jgi:hypothetical protein
MEDWGLQVDELLANGEYEEALRLLEEIDETVLTDKVRDQP